MTGDMTWAGETGRGDGPGRRAGETGRGDGPGRRAGETGRGDGPGRRHEIVSYLSLLADFSFLEVYFGYFIMELHVHSLYAVYKPFEHYF